LKGSKGPSYKESEAKESKGGAHYTRLGILQFSHSKQITFDQVPISDEVLGELALEQRELSLPKLSRLRDGRLQRHQRLLRRTAYSPLHLRALRYLRFRFH